MKLITAVFLILAVMVLLVASSWALECPMESLNIYHQDEVSTALSYSCDDGLETHIVRVPQGTTRKAIAELVLTGENATVLLNKACFRLDVLKMDICPDKQ